MGNSWEQDYLDWLAYAGIKRYKLRLYAYAEQDAGLHPQLHIERLYHHEVTGTVDSFKAQVFGELIFSTDRFLCLNYGFHSTKLRMAVLTNLWFKDCYKDLVDTIINWDGLFSSSARIIDLCTDSID